MLAGGFRPRKRRASQHSLFTGLESLTEPFSGISMLAFHHVTCRGVCCTIGKVIEKGCGYRRLMHNWKSPSESIDVKRQERHQHERTCTTSQGTGDIVDDSLPVRRRVTEL